MEEFAFPKVNPLHLPSRRQTRKAQYRTLRPDVRHDTWVRDGMRCRACLKAVLLTTDNPFLLANIHERTGGHKRAEEAIDITLRSTITYCAHCHASVEQHKGLRERILDDGAGYNGPVEFSGKLPSGEPLAPPRLSLPTVSPQDARRP